MLEPSYLNTTGNKLYQEKLYTFMISIIILSLNTPQSFISLSDNLPNFSHKSITTYWIFYTWEQLPHLQNPDFKNSDDKIDISLDFSCMSYNSSDHNSGTTLCPLSLVSHYLEVYFVMSIKGIHFSWPRALLQFNVTSNGGFCKHILTHLPTSHTHCH